jgi:hypothetical protein
VLPVEEEEVSISHHLLEYIIKGVCASLIGPANKNNCTYVSVAEADLQLKVFETIYAARRQHSSGCEMYEKTTLWPFKRHLRGATQCIEYGMKESAAFASQSFQSNFHFK